MIRPGIRWALGALLVAISAALAFAQAPGTQTLFVTTGSSPDARLGSVVGAADDVDGDGHGDLVVGSRIFGSRSLLTVFSGATTQALYVIPADRPGDFDRATLFPVDDLNGDGRPDLVVAAPLADLTGQPDAGVVYLFSGANGQRIKTITGSMVRNGQFGASAALLGDVNGDSVPELVVGEPMTIAANVPETGNVFIISLATGQSVQIVHGTVPGGHFGSAVAVLDDENNDGRKEFAVGAPLADVPGFAKAGIVSFISPADGREVGTLPGTEAQGQLGAALASAGDIDDDGRTDLTIGVPGHTVRAITAAGQVIVYTRVGGRTLFMQPGTFAGDRFGTVVAGGGDVNGDGRPDIVVGAPLADVSRQVDAGVVRVYSGVDGKLLRGFEGRDAGDQLGSAVAFARDVNGDGRNDVIFGAPFLDLPDAQDVGFARGVGFAGL